MGTTDSAPLRADRVSRTAPRASGFRSRAVMVVLLAGALLGAGCATQTGGIAVHGTLEIISYSEGALYLDGRPVADLAPGEHYVQDVPWGTYRVQMRFSAGSRETRRVDVPMLETITLVFAEEYGGIEVTSRTPGTVSVDGRTMGQTTEDDSATITDVPVGERSVEIEYTSIDDALGGSEMRTAIVERGVTSAVSFEQTFGCLRLTVPTAGDLYIDGVGIGAYESSTTTTVCGIPTGQRSLEMRYANGVQESVTASVRSVSQGNASFAGLANIEVTTVTDGTVFVDRVEQGSLAVGETMTVEGVRAGSTTISIRYPHGSTERVSVTSSANRTARAAFTHEFGAIHVTGPAAGTVSIRGRPETTFEPGRTLEFDGVLVGDYTVDIRYGDTGADSQTITVQPDEIARVEFAYGRVRVVAPASGTVTVDRSVPREVEGGSSVTFEGVLPGERSVEIRYANGGSESERVAVRSGETSSVAFEHLGSLRVTTRTPATVYVDGARAGRIVAGQSGVTVADLPAGARTIEIRYDGGEREQRDINVLPGTSVTARFTYTEPEPDRVTWSPDEPDASRDSASEERSEPEAEARSEPAPEPTPTPRPSAPSTSSSGPDFGQAMAGGTVWGLILGGGAALAGAGLEDALIATAIGFALGFFGTLLFG